MKRNFMKTILSAALTVGLLAGAAIAAPSVPATPVTTPGAQAPAYSVQTRTAAPIRVWGAVKEIGEGRIYLESSNKADPYGKIYVNVNEDTLVLDAVTGGTKSFADLKENETVYAYVSPAMTRSMPPISNAELVLCNIPADYAVPTYCEVGRVTVNEDGSVSADTNQDVILHLNGETAFVTTETAADAGEKPAAGPGNIRPGTKVLAWYSIMTLSLPAQATPTKIMVFPYEYESYVTLNDSGITVDGDMVVDGIVEENYLLLPLRTMAEITGCTIAWDNVKQTAVVSKGGQEIYSVTVGGEAAAVGEGGLALAVTPKIVDGTTYLALDDLLVLHNLKLAR